MRLSEQPEYLEAIPAKIQGNYNVARENLEALLLKTERMGDRETGSYLMQVLGDVEALAGNRAKAEALHLDGIRMFPTIPFGYLKFAKCLWHHLRDGESALKQISVAENVLKSSEWQTSGDDLPREWYELEFSTLRSAIARVET